MSDVRLTLSNMWPDLQLYVAGEENTEDKMKNKPQCHGMFFTLLDHLSSFFDVKLDCKQLYFLISLLPLKRR